METQMTPEQEKQVEEIRALLKSPWGVDFKHCEALLTIIDDLRKQLNASQLLREAAASLNKPMTDAEFKAELNASGADAKKQQSRKYTGLELEGIINSPYQTKAYTSHFMKGVKACARFMGAIKE